jgi:hypothetical protein
MFSMSWLVVFQSSRSYNNESIPLMTIPALTSPELMTLKNTAISLDARERLVKSDVILLRERIAAGTDVQPDDRAAQIEHTLAGGSVSAASDLTSQLGLAMLQWRAIDDAKDALSKKIHKAKRHAAAKVVAGLKASHDAMMKRACAAGVDFHSAHVELSALREELCAKEIGLFSGVCELLPDFLESPTNGYSAMADFFRAAVKAGYLDTIPKELRIS